MYLNQCLAISVYLPAIFNVKEEETELKNKLWKDTENLFISSMDVPGELSDGGLNGRVHLGLFYYLTNQKDKSMKTLAETANSARDHWRLVLMLLMNEKN